MNQVFGLIFIVQRNDATDANNNTELRKQTILSTLQTGKKKKNMSYMDANSVSVVKACLLLYFCYILSQRLPQICSTFIFDSQNITLICVLKGK